MPRPIKIEESLQQLANKTLKTNKLNNVIIPTIIRHTAQKQPISRSPSQISIRLHSSEYNKNRNNK
jgi:hypothetical protein